MSEKRVLIAAGGTGGHIYPAMSLALNLMKRGVKVHFAGSGLKSNQFFDRNKFSFTETTSGFLSTKNPLKLMRGAFHIAKGIVESRKILKSFSPDLVIGFGSFHTFPLLSAAKLSNIPLVLHEQNAMPGRVNRIFSPYALFTAVSIPDAIKRISGKTVEVNMPLKLEKQAKREEARKYFNLGNLKTILVFGGSQGASGINQAFLKCVKDLKEVQVIHFTGSASMPPYGDIPACVKDFESRMDLAWAMADLAITRSGASTIAEAIEYEVPLIMVPFPKAMDNHQEKNADFMIERVGGGIKILEKDLDTLLKCMRQMPLEEMRRAIKEYKKNRKTAELSDLIMETL